MVAELDALGRIRRFDQYDLERLDEARARFAELRPDPLRIPPNAATRTERSLAGGVEAAGLGSAPGALCAPRSCSTIAAAASAPPAIATLSSTSSSAIAELGGTRCRAPLLATAGDRLALERVCWTRPTIRRRPFEVETLQLIEVDAEGRIVAAISFDPDDRRAASAELLRSPIAQAPTPIEARDERPRSRPAPRRAAGRLRLERPPAHRTRPAREGRLRRLAGRAVRAAPDVIVEPLLHRRRGQARQSRRRPHVRHARGRRRVRVRHACGLHRSGASRSSGSSCSSPRISTPRGRASRSCAPTRCASRRTPRRGPAIAGWSASRHRTGMLCAALCAPRSCSTTAAASILITGDRDMVVANSQCDRRVRRVPRAACSPPRAIGWRSSASSGRSADQGAVSEVETLQIMEVDAEGRLVAAIVFDPDDRRAASAELLARDPHSDARQARDGRPRSRPAPRRTA